MFDGRGTFISACLSGTALLDDVDDWVEEWHESPQDMSLDDFLGFSHEEGALWAERPESLRFIVAAHRYGKPVQTILLSRDDFALAARASDSAEATAVLGWLRQTNRL
ncbi:hypothetical protein HAV21_11030 [Paenarthrobacter sp. MSM-2-10-13]|uniref:hypothetical protein n=1 Tax=Paenarthrobacter sp. MSM-2-10-13 TaxID=2717318 RepID=UPI000FAB7617|nr:hypothetical protein [Paenarthrobacter sp. MSM-2-10-13]NHW47418.1 hypothetical protein [Paenarthrobacter sp. MSM-2-10-13]